MQTPPPCPSCGNTKSVEVDHHLVYRPAEVFEPLPRQPLATVYVFECPCGRAFPHMVPHVQADQKNQSA
ncbi:MAG: hypothetical protein WD872_09415 [Pirellulaceae bacterium]